MLQDEYKRELERLGPGQEELERLYAMIEGGQGVRSAKRLGRRAAAVLTAAALCAALGITALAVSPTLKEILSQTLGSFEPYSQSVEGVSAEDQGIQIRVISALSDGNIAQVYYEIQDLTGDRLDEFTVDDLAIPRPLNWDKDGDVRWVAAGSASIGGLVYYDEETRTALMVGAVLGDGPPAEKLALSLDISQIIPGWRHGSFPVDPAWIAEGTLRSETTENGKSVLVPGQDPRPLDCEFFSLSSYGFGEDGLLHLQLKVEADDSEWEWGSSDVCYSGGWSRSDTASDLSRSARYAQTTDYMGMTEEEMEFAAPETCFQKDGVTYYDIRTGITPDDVAEGDVEWVENASYFLNTRPIIRGEWYLEVPVEMIEQTSVDMTPSQTEIKGVSARTLHLSVLGCTLESDPNGTASTLGYPMTLYLSDGTVLAGIDSDGMFHAGGYAVNHWTFPQPVEPEQVEAIALGQWYVPIKEGAAQPGYWLSELPK